MSYVNFSHDCIVPVLYILQSTFSEFVPLLVELCTNIVELRGLDITGIYRVPGNTAVLSSLTEGVNRGFDSISLQVFFVMNSFSSPQLSIYIICMQHYDCWFRCSDVHGLSRNLVWVFEVLTAVLLRIHVFWDVMLCHWASGPRHSEASECLHLQASGSPKQVIFDCLNHEYDGSMIP